MLLVVQLVSCGNKRNKLVDNGVNRATITVKNWISPHWPKNSKHYKTTDSLIYLANLNSSIEVFNRLYNKTNKAQYGKNLANKLYLRFRIKGDFDDAIDALNIINQVSRDNNKNDADIHLILAKIQSGFHRFDAALKSLVMAESIGLKNQNLSTLEDEIRYSLGQYKPYESIIHNRKINSLAKAKYALLNNYFEQASSYYKKEMDAFNDTDPFKLSWLQLQQGIAFLRYGDLESAKLFFLTAHQRFPEYYLATEHLAETEYLLGNFNEAKLLYQKVIKQTNNPEFYAQLAKVEAKLGNHRLSKKALKQAQMRFDKLIYLYPKAISDHAVQFYLDNNQITKALNFAKFNLQNRKNIESYELLINSALANNNRQLACNTYAKARELKVAPLEFYQLSSELACSNIAITTH